MAQKSVPFINRRARFLRIRELLKRDIAVFGFYSENIPSYRGKPFIACAVIIVIGLCKGAVEVRIDIEITVFGEI